MFGVTSTPSLTIAKLANANIGFLGIGTTEPKELVHINDGNLMLTNTNSSTKNVIQMGEGYLSWIIERLNSQVDGNGLNFSVDRTLSTGPGERGGTSVLFLDSDAKVGVGTKNPTTKLDVAGGLKARNAEITQTLTANSATIPHLIGTTIADELKVDGIIEGKDAYFNGIMKAKEVLVTLTGWPDYVFCKDYKLLPLQELEKFVNENQHLPNVPSAATVEEKGVELGEMNALLLKKIEELTLYILDLQKQIDELKNR